LRVQALRRRLDRADRLGPALRGLTERFRERLLRVEATLGRLPGRVAAGGHRRLLASRCEQMTQLMRARLVGAEVGVAAKLRTLESLSPRRVLDRGYSITTIKGRSKPIKDPAQVRTGQILVTRLAGGDLRSLATDRPVRRRSTNVVSEDQPSLFDDPREQAGDRNGNE
jgi:exodeoxyribonuclease VII large subunit